MASAEAPCQFPPTPSSPSSSRARLGMPEPRVEIFNVGPHAARVFDFPSLRARPCGALEAGEAVAGMRHGEWVQLEGESALQRVRSLRWPRCAALGSERRLCRRWGCSEEEAVEDVALEEGSLWMYFGDCIADTATDDPASSLGAFDSFTMFTLPVDQRADSLEAPPIFVCGAGRSGTTLVADLMGMHSGLSPVYETEFVSSIASFAAKGGEEGVDYMDFREDVLTFMDGWAQQLPRKSSSSKAEYECYHHGPHYLLFSRELAMELTHRFLDEVRVGRPIHQALARFCSDLFADHLRRDGKRMVVNKTPSYVYMLPVLAAMYPQLKVVHCVRDGRDVACSVVPRPFGPSSIRGAAAWWADRVEAAVAWGSNHPSRYHEVRFEDLVLQPKQELAKLFQFVGVADESASIVERRGLEVDLDKSRIGKWQCLPRFMLESFQQGRAGSALAHCGYTSALPCVEEDCETKTESPRSLSDQWQTSGDASAESRVQFSDHAGGEFEQVLGPTAMEPESAPASRRQWPLSLPRAPLSPALPAQQPVSVQAETSGVRLPSEGHFGTSFERRRGGSELVKAGLEITTGEEPLPPTSLPSAALPLVLQAQQPAITIGECAESGDPGSQLNLRLQLGVETSASTALGTRVSGPMAPSRAGNTAVQICSQCSRTIPLDACVLNEFATDGGQYCLECWELWDMWEDDEWRQAQLKLSGP